MYSQHLQELSDLSLAILRACGAKEILVINEGTWPCFDMENRGPQFIRYIYCSYYFFFIIQVFRDNFLFGEKKSVSSVIPINFRGVHPVPQMSIG